MLSEWMVRARFFLKGKRRVEVDEELQFHLDRQIEANVSAGMSREEARRQAAIGFGGVERAREQCREERPSWTLELVLRDVIVRAMHVAGMLSRPIIPVPLALAQFGCGFLERLPFAPLTRAGIDFASESFVADTGRLLANVSLVLTPFETGLANYLKHRTKASPQ